MKIGIGTGIENSSIAILSNPYITSVTITGEGLVGKTLTCTVVGGGGTPTYQWNWNGTPISGATSSTYGPIAYDAGDSITCEATIGAVSMLSNAIVINAFELLMDSINLQSYDSSKFTITSSKIETWLDNSGFPSWTQSNASLRPVLTGGVPTFGGSGISLLRVGGDISATVYTAYFVVRNVAETTDKAMFSSASGTNWFNINNNYESRLVVGGVAKLRSNGGYKGKRDAIISIRRNGTTITMYVNNRKMLEVANTFVSEATLFGQLMTITGFAAFALNGTLKAVCLTSSYLSESVHQSNINDLYSLYNLSTNTATDTILAFGDSNTKGQGVTSYVVSLATSLGLGYANLGIAGSLYTNVGATANNGYDRYNESLISTPNTDYVVIQYGTNDILNAVSDTTYGTQLDAKIAEHIAAGISPSSICLCSVPYQQSSANATALNNYRTKVLATATLYGTKYYDLLQDMRDNGGDTLLSDTVHLNATGQALWAAGVLFALTN